MPHNDYCQFLNTTKGSHEKCKCKCHDDKFKSVEDLFGNLFK